MSADDGRRKGLGRGLSALMGDDGAAFAQQEKSRTSPRELPIEALFPNPGQPRRVFDEAKLDELQRAGAEQLRLLESVDAKLEACLESTLGRLDGLAASVAAHDLFLGVTLSALVRGVEELQGAAKRPRTRARAAAGS
jgi:hypothetical protein